MAIELVLVQQDGKQRTIPLRNGSFVIGREKGCAIRLAQPLISRQHCEVSCEGNRVFLKDLGSSNGTFVNAKRVSQLELSAGDVVGLGPFALVARINGQPGSVDSAQTLSKLPPKPAATPAPASEATKLPPLSDEEESDDSFENMDFDELLDEDEEPKL